MKQVIAHSEILKNIKGWRKKSQGNFRGSERSKKHLKTANIVTFSVDKMLPKKI
jgi:hypothetical protein